MEHSGRVVWHDLMTVDVDRAEAFYAELLGWEVNEVALGGSFGDYRMIRAGEWDIGGLVRIELSAGYPSHWMSYVTVDDVDAAARRAQAGGGIAVVPPTDIPNIGRFTVVRDPEGAGIAPFKSVHPHSPERLIPPGPGRFCWEELLTKNPGSALRFYADLFGWSTVSMPMPEFTYHLFRRDDRDVAGAMQMPPGADAPPHWISYIHVEDVDASAARAMALGSAQYVEPRDIPSIGRFSVHGDPTGATFALFQPKI